MRLMVALAAVVLALSGCGNTADEAPVGVEVFFVGETSQGFRLFSEVREFDGSKVDLTTEVLSALISGELQPLDPDYVNLWDSSHALRGITVSGGTATVDIALGKLNVGAEGEQRAIDQIVWTLLEADPSLDALRFLVNGNQVESFAGHVDVTTEFRRAPSYEVLSPINITSLEEKAEVSSPVEISGQACTFEANVVWSLFDGATLVSEGFVTADSACPERSGWRVGLGELEPGTYLFRAQELSAKDNSVVAEDTKTFIVR
jgi:hypothetical protein